MPLVAIIDIGSTSVGGALLNVPRRARRATKEGVSGVCVEIVKAVRHQVAFQENIDVKRFLTGMEGAIKDTIADLQSAAPSRIICFLSSPFHASQTRLINHKAEKPFAITTKLVADLVAAELDKFKAGQKDLFATGEGRSGHEVIESKIMQIKLNGYSTPQPYGQRVGQIDIANFISISSRDILDRFKTLVTGGFHQTKVEWHSFAFTFFNILSELLGPGHDFLLLDIGGEITELSLSWRGLLWNTSSFPLGCNALVRYLAREFATTKEEAYASLQLYLEQKQRPALAAKIEKALLPLRTKWLATFRQSLSQVVEGSFLPANIYLVGDLLLLPLFKRWLTEESFNDFALSDKKLAVNIIESDWLDRFCHHGDNVGRDLSLMVETIFCDKLIRQ